jgi:hypothetical protein
MDETGFRLVAPKEYPVALEHNAREGSRGSPCSVKARSLARRSRRSAPEGGPQDSGTRVRRGLSDAPKGCSIAHSLIDRRGGSRSTAEDYRTRRKACSIARRRCSERGRRPLRLYGHRRPQAARTRLQRCTREPPHSKAASCLHAAPRLPWRSSDRTNLWPTEQRGLRRRPRCLCWPSGRSSRYDSLKGIKINQQKNKTVALGSAHARGAKS